MKAEGGEIKFDYRFLDDIELAQKQLDGKWSGDDDEVAEDEADRKSLSSLVHDRESSQLQMLGNKTRISQDHPLTIMVSSNYVTAMNACLGVLFEYVLVSALCLFVCKSSLGPVN